MAKIKGFNWKKELGEWTKPTKGFSLRLGKTAYHIAKGVVRHPYLTIAGTLAVKGASKAGKYSKGLKLGQGPLASRVWRRGGKWML